MGLTENNADRHSSNGGGLPVVMMPGTAGGAGSYIGLGAGSYTGLAAGSSYTRLEPGVLQSLQTIILQECLYYNSTITVLLPSTQ